MSRSNRVPLLAAVALLGFGLSGLVATPAHALPKALEDAKASGAIGEQADGYLGVRTNVSADVRAALDDVNSQRSAKYAKVAEKRGTDPAAAAAVTGTRLLDREPAGHWIRNEKGKWVQKQ
jgi:uncharacterized protein YdbL (DUF1318 family)